MSTLLAPLAPVAKILLPSSGHNAHTALPDQLGQPDTTETTPTATATSTSLDTAILTVPNSKKFGISVSNSGVQGVFSGNSTTVPNVRALNTPARVTGFRDMPMQSLSTHTDNNNELQCTTKFLATTRLCGTFPGKGSPTRLPLLEKTGHNAGLFLLPLTQHYGSNRLQISTNIFDFPTTATYYLRTAGARDLPSYPTIGLSHPEAAGAAAALLAHRSHKPVEIWRPGPISAAGAAASLAHTKPTSVRVWEPASSKPAGKAALYALEGSSFPQLYTMPESSKRWSLTGAIGAMQSSKGKRLRSGSSPMPLTIRQGSEAASVGNSALTAATIAHMPPSRRLSVATADPTSEGIAESKVLDAGRVPQQDKRRSDIVRAATVSMSKGNRDTILPPDIPRQKHFVQPDLQRLATTPPSGRYNSNIQEAARKVAAERLEKTGCDTDCSPSVSLLGTQGAQTSVNRSYSVTSVGSSDTSQARKADAEMALLQDSLARVDAKKRGENAVLLMSAAQRNVQARMSEIDKQVTESRGVIRRENWDEEAIQIAQEDSGKRIKHQRKVSIGGAYMTQEEIDAIAEKSVQPVLDDINRRADIEKTKIESERARDLEVHLDIEESKRVHDLQRTREREKREDIRRAKVAEKEDGKRRKEEEKRAIKERKQLAKIDSKRERGPMGTGDVELLRSPVSPTSPLSDSSNREGGIRGLINRFRRRHSRQISRDGGNSIFPSVPIERSTFPTFSGGHRAALAEEQHANEANSSRVVANGNPRPVPTSRIPRPVSMAVVPQINGATKNSKTRASSGAVRPVAIASIPSVVTNSTEKTPVKRRHSLSSMGATDHYPKGRKRADEAVLSPSCAEEKGIKGTGKILARKVRDFTKLNGRITSTEDHSEYPDEARDTFSQQSTSFVPLNRPSGYFPHDERRFSAGETSISSRFREDL